MDTLFQTVLNERILSALHVLSPTAVTVAYVTTSLADVFGSKKSPSAQKNNGPRKPFRVACLAFTVLVMATYIFESIFLGFVLPTHAATSSDENLVFTLFSSLVWLILFLGLWDYSSADIRRIFMPAWIVALVFDVALLTVDINTPKLSGAARIGRRFAQAMRITLLLALAAIAVGDRLIRRLEKSSDEEIAPLLARIESHLGASGAHTNGEGYGTATAADSKKADGKDSDQSKADDPDEDFDDVENYNADNLDWWVYTKAFAIFIPYLWPKKNLMLQLHFPALCLCLLARRALNVLVPLQLGIVVNVLRNNGGNVPWTAIGLFVFLRLLDSSAGISLAQSWLWLPLEKYTAEELNAAAYGQLMNLSSDFHDSKKSGKMWRIVSRAESLVNLVHSIGFEMVPMAVDLAIAVSVFWWLFDAYMAFIAALSSVLFLWSTTKTVPLKNKRQRELNKAWEDEWSQMTESSLNWTTVSYFNRIRYEQGRYEEAVSTSQSAWLRSRAFSLIISALRSLTLLLGLMVAAVLGAYQISNGSRSVGDFVVLITYWAQLSLPLAYFANGFSIITRSLVDAEKLLELLQMKPSVGNHEDAVPFVLKQGQVDFDRVCFSYDGKRQVVDNLCFRVEPGQTVALVGETGGGKSTILKLLFRFYDANSGHVMIDGQDVKYVTLESLRANIGCVPQDPALFNQTILQNLRYAKLDATEEEVQAACKAAALHDKIMSFTRGYQEKVGERGVKLSGGELQRMAIARAILKDPKILLLDEATSSVDSETEAVIQNSLKKLCAGRTTFVIAHRLSTIVHANLVMVIQNGRVIERGSHDKLLQVSGHYSKLWSRQLRLQTGEECPRSRSRSPEKTAVLADDVTESDIESREGLRKRQKHEKRVSGKAAGSSSGDRDVKKTAEPVMDANSRGRSPGRNDKAWEKFDSMRRKVLNSMSPRRQTQDESQEGRCRSYSPTRTSLKPDAPEFVPQGLQKDVQDANGPTRSSQSVDEHVRRRAYVSPSRVTAGGCLSKSADAEKENFRLPRFGSHVLDGQGRKTTSSVSTSAKSSSTEHPAVEGRLVTPDVDSQTRA